MPNDGERAKVTMPFLDRLPRKLCEGSFILAGRRLTQETVRETRAVQSGPFSSNEWSEETYASANPRIPGFGLIDQSSPQA